MDTTISWQKAEGAIILAAGVWLYLLGADNPPWWIAIIIFFAPDVSFIAYLLGPKVGAFVYNLVHVYAFGAGILVLGTALSNPLVASLGTLWLAHSGLDRMLGYGLKSQDGFHITHLGRIGKKPTI